MFLQAGCGAGSNDPTGQYARAGIFLNLRSHSRAWRKIAGQATPDPRQIRLIHRAVLAKPMGPDVN